MEAEHPPRSIKQWYKKTTNLNRHWKENRREKERLSKRKETRNQISRANIPANAREIQRQWLL